MGYAPAQYTVAMYYGRGQGTAKDDKEAFNYLLKSAKQDFDMAYGALANCYYWGKVRQLTIPKPAIGVKRVLRKTIPQPATSWVVTTIKAMPIRLTMSKR